MNSSETAYEKFCDLKRFARNKCYVGVYVDNATTYIIQNGTINRLCKPFFRRLRRRLFLRSVCVCFFLLNFILIWEAASFEPLRPHRSDVDTRACEKERNVKWNKLICYAKKDLWKSRRCELPR